jgi:hypothetical protein
MLARPLYVILVYESKNEDAWKKDPAFKLGSKSAGSCDDHCYLYSGHGLWKGYTAMSFMDQDFRGSVHLASTTVYSVVYGIAIKVFKVLMLIAGFSW